MGLLDEIGNSVIVSTLKQFLNRTDHEIFFGYPANWYIPQEYSLLSVEVHKNHTLVGRHQKESKCEC